MSVLEYLHSKGLKTKPAGSMNVHLACFYCGESESKRGRLYVNIDDDADIVGLHMCHLCGTRGSIIKIRKFFGDPIESASIVSENRLQILSAALAFYKDCLSSKPEVVKYLQRERGLSTETIEHFNLGWGSYGLLNHLVSSGFSIDDIRKTSLIGNGDREFLEGRIVLPYMSAGSPVLLRGRAWDGGPKYVTPPSQKARLFNSDAIWSGDEQKQIIVTEGEFDAMVLHQMGFRTVGIPGAQSWQPQWKDYFSSFRKVFIVFDNDTAGVAGASKIAEAIGANARIVSLPEESNDVSEFIVDQGNTESDFAELLKVNAASLLVTVKEAYDEWSWLQGQSGLKFNIPHLDYAFSPGLLPGQLMVTLASSGVGKTISLMNFMYGITVAQPEAKILFLSLEQTRGDWFERARRIHGFYNPDLCPKKPSEFESFKHELHKETISYWSNRLMIADKNRITEDEVYIAIEDFEEAMGAKPDLVCVDYLGYWSNSFKGKDKYEQVSRAVMSMKAIAKETRIPFISPGQLNRTAVQGDEPSIDQARDSGVIVETSDFVVAMWSGDTSATDLDDKTGSFSLRIGKSRHGGKGTLLNMQFGYLSLTLVPIESPNAAYARKEVDYLAERKGWEYALMKHSGG